MLDPEGVAPVPLRRPIIPDFIDFHARATKFADLNQAEQKSFMNAQHIYDTQLKEYNFQAQKLLEVRNKIQLSVSDTKKALLPTNKTTREWLRILIDSTKPTFAMAQQAIELRYRNAITPLRTTSAKVVLLWIEEWETVMAEGIRAELPNALNTQSWLRDFCTAIRGIAESVATMYEWKLTEGVQDVRFQVVGSVFRSWFITQYPSSKASKPTIRGSAFGTRFAGENASPDEDRADTTDQGASNMENSRKRQRANTSSVPKGQKVKRVQCKACDRPHDITKCWLAVEASRPPGWIPTQKAVDELERRLKKQKSLAELVEKARREHKDSA